MLTHRNLVANLCQIQASFPIDEDDVLIGCLPFFHIYGMTVIMNQGLRAGATIVTMPRFDLDQFLDADRGARRHARLRRARRSRWRSPSTRPSTSATSRACRRSCPGAAPLGAELAERVAERIDCR